MESTSILQLAKKLVKGDVHSAIELAIKSLRKDTKTIKKKTKSLTRDNQELESQK